MKIKTQKEQAISIMNNERYSFFKETYVNPINTPGEKEFKCIVEEIYSNEQRVYYKLLYTIDREKIRCLNYFDWNDLEEYMVNETGEVSQTWGWKEILDFINKKEEELQIATVKDTNYYIINEHKCKRIEKE